MQILMPAPWPDGLVNLKVSRGTQFFADVEDNRMSSSSVLVLVVVNRGRKNTKLKFKGLRPTRRPKKWKIVKNTKNNNENIYFLEVTRKNS